jgi:hypothetical protein
VQAASKRRVSATEHAEPDPVVIASEVQMGRVVPVPVVLAGTMTSRIIFASAPHAAHIDARFGIAEVQLKYHDHKTSPTSLRLDSVGYGQLVPGETSGGTSVVLGPASVRSLGLQAP